MYLMRSMAALRAGRSVVNQQIVRHAGMPSSNPRSLLMSAAARTFASEPGFLDKSEVSDRVLEVVRKFEKVQPEKVTSASHFVNDLGLDSLDAVELVMALEDEFAIEIKDDDAEKILSCEDAISFLSNNVNAK